MAVGDLYINQGTTITFDSTPTDVALTLTSLASGSIRYSAPADLAILGDGAGPGLYQWGLKTKFATTPVLDEVIDIYLALSDGTNDFNISQTDHTETLESTFAGAKWIGSLVVNEASTTASFTAFGEVFIPTKQVQAVIANGTADGLSATAADHAFYLTPLPYKKQ